MRLRTQRHFGNDGIRSVASCASVAAISCLLLGVTGCSSSDAGLGDAGADSSELLRPGDAGIEPRGEVPDEFRPTVEDGTIIAFAKSEYADGSPTHYADGSPAYMPDGSPIDYRPRNIQQTLLRLPTVYVRAGDQEVLGGIGPVGGRRLLFLPASADHRVELDGNLRDARIDPQTGEVCWLPFVCNNRACSGRSGENPFEFVIVDPSVTAEQLRHQHTSRTEQTINSQTNAPTLPAAVELWKRIHCPKCGGVDTLGRHVLPSTEAEQKRLLEELARIRSSSQ